MCTSFTYNIGEKNHFLGRTMDFSMNLDGSPVFLPRNFTWESHVDKENLSNKYAIMGAGKNLLGKYMIADAFNEKGLSCAELYFNHEAIYEPEPITDKINLVAEEFIMWILGNCSSIEDLRSKLDQVAIIEQGILLNQVQPLHWIISDTTGKTVIIEPKGEGLKLTEDIVGVMTNSPDYEWHLKNLNEYMDLQPEPYPNRTYGDYEVQPFGMGNGSQGLPGGYMPSQRFIRAVYSKQYVSAATTIPEAINNMLHIMDNVTLPKNVVLDENGTTDFTQYQGISSLEEKAYYFISYSNRLVYRSQMTEDMIENIKEPIVYEVDSNQYFENLN